MKRYSAVTGVPDFTAEEYQVRQTKYCICIPVINEGGRIHHELLRAKAAGVDRLADIILCDGGSTDGSMERDRLLPLGVNSLLVKQGAGRQGAQLRMGFWWALQRGYEGIITIDGNDKDSIESVPLFIDKLSAGFDFVQGSRFLRGGAAVRTPLVRYWAVRLLHAPVISLTAGHWFTDTTNAFRAYSRRYLEHPEVEPFREVFQAYELLAYLSVRASQLGLRACEVPVRREYPAQGRTPTKISFWQGNRDLLGTLFRNLLGRYAPSAKGDNGKHGI